MDGKEDARLIEFSYAQVHAPPGVYILPSADKREGVHLPEKYPEEAPSLYFVSKVYHPIVDATDGTVNIRWAAPEKDTSAEVTAMSLLDLVRKMFYFKKYFRNVESKIPFANVEAANCFATDSQRFLMNVNESVTASERELEFMFPGIPALLSSRSRGMSSSSSGDDAALPVTVRSHASDSGDTARTAADSTAATDGTTTAA
eukprot:Lankesteria_metandrocarpae@DN4935_c0_g1_i1.p1